MTRTTNTEALTEETETEEGVDETPEEETEEESTDDSEETESEEESDDSGKAATLENEEESIEQVLDLAKLPPQLREAGKRMQATLQKEREKQKVALAKYKSELEEQLGIEFAQHVQYAKGFQNIVNVPGFKEFWADFKAGNPYGYTSLYNRNPSNKESSDEDDSSADSEGKISVDAVVKKVMSQIGPMIQKEIAPIQQLHAKTTYENAEKNLPNFNKYRAKITQLMTDEGMSMERAYTIASEPDRIKAAVDKALQDAHATAAKLNKNKTTKPSIGSKSGGTLSKKTINSIEDAVNSALSGLSGG